MSEPKVEFSLEYKGLKEAIKNNEKVEKEFIKTLTKPSSSKVFNKQKVVNEWLYKIEFESDKRIRSYYETRIREEFLVL
jgi:hypothetical protein